MRVLVEVELRFIFYLLSYVFGGGSSFFGRRGVFFFLFCIEEVVFFNLRKVVVYKEEFR